MDALQRAVAQAGGTSALARELGVSPQVVTNWLARRVPTDMCPAIERVTGVRCEELRPDVEWGVLRTAA